jgi:tetratricopeptide (TPR) repeat protein
MLSKFQDLNNYLLKGRGITRSSLNIMFVVCLFIFPWLILIVYYRLGRTLEGWAYSVPYMLLSLAAQSVPALAIIALIIHVTAWVHANKVLTDYLIEAQLRLDELDEQQDDQTDALLEKGVILNKVFCDHKQAMDILNNALSKEDGNVYLLNQAGLVMAEQKMYKEAAVFFNRAYPLTNDLLLVKRLNKNLKRIGKKLRRANFDMNVYELAKTTSAA